MSRTAVRAALQAVLFLTPVVVSAQALHIAARDTAPVAAMPGTTVTAVLRITNSSARRITVIPRIDAPAEWSVPIGTLPFVLSAGEGDSWIIGIRIPARAPAGRYRIAIAAQDSDRRASTLDSLTVQVGTVRGLALTLTNRPTYAVSGSGYQAVFLVQNNGNVPTAIKLRGTSGLGGIVVLDSTPLTLAAGAMRRVVVRVATHTTSPQAVDDVLELYALDRADSTIAALASARVTIVQEANTAEPLHRLASQLRVRAGEAGAGVSPYELIGSGTLRDDGDEQVAYVVRGSPGPMAQFGDQVEYRAELRGSNYTARVGDGLYSASPLSSSGQTGIGAGLDLHEGVFRAGAFAQRYRFPQGASGEAGGYLSVNAADMFASPTLSVNALSRRDGSFAGQVLGAGAALRPLDLASVDFEVAGSNGPLGQGSASSARLSGGDRVRYDVGHIGGSDTFAGIGRGSSHDYADVTARLTDDLHLSAATGSHKTRGVLLGLQAPLYFRSSTMELAYRTRLSVQYAALTRTTNFGSARLDDWQRGVLARAENDIGPVRLWGSAGLGAALTSTSGRRPYHELSLGATTRAGQSFLTLYGETSEGMSITRGVDNIVTFGGDGRLPIGGFTTVFLSGFQTTLLSAGDHYAQLEGGVTQLIPDGSSISIRMRIATNDRVRQLAFLEYTMPLGLPIGRSRSVGRVRGQVLDRDTGRGVAGTLVRLGRQAAITDDEGRVAFAGLPAGEYRLSIAQQASQASTVIAGVSTVTIDSGRKSPTTFSVALERAAIVEGSVRQMAVARTGIESAPDSLADAGALEGVSLALIGVRDTLFAVTDAAGSYRFADVVSGAYILKAMIDAPAGMRWEPAEIDVSVKPASVNEVTFRQVPRRRSVQMIPSDINPARKK